MADAALHTLYFKKETAWGATPAGITGTAPSQTSGYDGMVTARLTGCTLGLTKDSIVTEELRADRQLAGHAFGIRQVGGDLNGEFTYSPWLEDLMESALQGTWSEAGTGATLKSGVTRKSFLMVRYFDRVNSGGDTKIFLPYTGVEVNTMTVNAVANGIATFTMGVLGKEQLPSVAAAPWATAPGATSTTDMMTGALGTMKENGSDNALCTEVSFTIENGLEIRPVIGSNYTIFPSTGRSLVTGSATFYFESMEILNRYINSTDSSLEFSVRDAANVIPNSYNFLIPQIKYTGGQPDVSGQGSIVLTMPFQGLYKNDSDMNLKITRTSAAAS